MNRAVCKIATWKEQIRRGVSITGRTESVVNRTLAARRPKAELVQAQSLNQIIDPLNQINQTRFGRFRGHFRGQMTQRTLHKSIEKGRLQRSQAAFQSGGGGWASRRKNPAPKLFDFSGFRKSAIFEIV
jgi:hypothetical protein